MKSKLKNNYSRIHNLENYDTILYIASSTLPWREACQKRFNKVTNMVQKIQKILKTQNTTAHVVLFSAANSNVQQKRTFLVCLHWLADADVMVQFVKVRIVYDRANTHCTTLTVLYICTVDRQIIQKLELLFIGALLIKFSAHVLLLSANMQKRTFYTLLTHVSCFSGTVVQWEWDNLLSDERRRFLAAITAFSRKCVSVLGLF